MSLSPRPIPRAGADDQQVARELQRLRDGERGSSDPAIDAALLAAATAQAAAEAAQRTADTALANAATAQAAAEAAQRTADTALANAATAQAAAEAAQRTADTATTPAEATAIANERAAATPGPIILISNIASYDAIQHRFEDADGDLVTVPDGAVVTLARSVYDAAIADTDFTPNVNALFIPGEDPDGPAGPVSGNTVSFTLPAPTTYVRRSGSQEINWAPLPNNSGFQIPNNLLPAAATRYLRGMAFRAGNSPSVLRVRNSDSGGGSEDGQDLSTAWESSAVAIRLAYGGNTVTLKGPNHPDNPSRDSTEQYVWTPSATDRAALGAWISALGSRVSGVVLTLDDGTGSNS